MLAVEAFAQPRQQGRMIWPSTPWATPCWQPYGKRHKGCSLRHCPVNSSASCSTLKPKRAPSQSPLPASAVTPDTQHRPLKPKPAPSRLAQVLAVHQRNVAPVSLDTTSSLAASLIPLMMRSCHLSPFRLHANYLQDLHLVQAMYHAFYVRRGSQRTLQPSTTGLFAGNGPPSGSSPDGADLLAAAVIIHQGTAPEYGRCGGAELAGTYNMLTCSSAMVSISDSDGIIAHVGKPEKVSKHAQKLRPKKHPNRVVVPFTALLLCQAALACPSPNPTPKKKPKRQPLLTDWVKGTAVQRPQQLQKSSSAMGAATVSRSKAKYKCLGCQVPTLQKAEYAVKPGWLC
ncbi:hypothetical protein WJX79_004344 [Trebouxia sp. C0005]